MRLGTCIAKLWSRIRALATSTRMRRKAGAGAMPHSFRPLSSVARIGARNERCLIRGQPRALVVMPETITGDRQAARGRFSATPSLPDLFWRAADFVDKILRGAKPGGIRS